MHEELNALLTPVHRISRDMMKALRNGGGGITDNEARFLVDLYYMQQKQRIGVNNRIKGLDRDAKAAETTAEPHEALDWTLTQTETLEKQVVKILAAYVEAHPMAWFFERTLGVGPVIAAGLLAHIDITQAPTAGHIWNFAGLNPGIKWEKGAKRPWNAQLKTLCWKLGESFIKVSGRKDAFYGQVFRDRKAYEWKGNIAGKFADQAAHKLDTTNIGKSTDAYAWYSGACSPEKAAAMLEDGKTPTVAGCRVESGGVAMLPPDQINSRARRYAVKLFLSHLQECWYRTEYATEPPKPFATAILGHAHYIAPPQLMEPKESH